MPIAYKRERVLSSEEIAMTEAIEKILGWHRWIPLATRRRRKRVATLCAFAAWDALGRPAFKRPAIHDEDFDDDDGGAGIREPRRPSPQAPDDELGLEATGQS